MRRTPHALPRDGGGPRRCSFADQRLPSVSTMQQRVRSVSTGSAQFEYRLTAIRELRTARGGVGR